MKLMKLTPDSEIPGGKAEKDANGNLTGVFTGGNRTFNLFTAKIPGRSTARGHSECQRGSRHHRASGLS
jgi:hypothetical protein